MKKCAVKFGLLSILVLCLSVSIPVSAQVSTGEATGTVTDQSGAAVPGASITAECPATKQTRTVTSGGVGEYRLADMPACVYKVSVSSQGFKTTVREVTVVVAQTTKADFQLQVGQRTETITVEAAAPLVDFALGLSTDVDTKAIVDLPTEGRDFKSILGITPGVQRSPGGGFLDVSITGQRTTTNNYMIDGMPNNDRFYGSEVVGQPGVLGIPASVLGGDSIQEYSVQQLPSAENGVKGGAAVNVVLKSGTNDLHGTGFYFGDYDWLNAKNFFTGTTTPYHNHNYGGTVGGPIIKNRTFFFADFEGQRNKSTEPYTLSVPTQGDLACALANLNNTAKAAGCATLNTTGAAFPVNPAGLALLKYYPCSDGTGKTVSCTPAAANAAVGTGGFVQTIASPNTDKMSSFKIKIDHKMNEKMQFSGRYIFADSVQSAPLGGYTIPPAAGSGLGADGFNSIAPTRVQVAGATWTYTISPTKILDVRFNWNRYAQILAPNNTINPLSLGIDTGPLNPADFGVPPIYASSVTYGNIGGIFGYPLSTRPTQNYDASVHYTWIKGTHTFKMGGNYDYASSFSLRNRARSSLTSFAVDFPTFLSELLTGRIDEAARSFGDTSRHLLQPSMGIFFQDEWKLRPRLTVTLGLRWEVNGALGDADKTASNFFPCGGQEPTVCAPKGFPNGLVREQIGFQRLYNLDLHDFGPRAGVAWDVFGNGKTLLKAGYSMTYDVANFAAISAPYSFQGGRAGSFTNPDLGVFSVKNLGGAVANAGVLFEPLAANTCFNPAVNTATPDWICMGPQPGPAAFGGSTTVPYQTYGATPTATPPFNIFGTIPDLKNQRIQYYNATLQHELFKDNVISVSYFGAHGTNSFLNRSLNQRQVGCFTAAGQQTGPAMSATNTTNLDCTRPLETLYPQFAVVNQLTNDGYLRYNSMEITYRQRNWHGINSITNFTWSNCIDTNSVNRGGGATLPISLNPYKPDSNRGPCDTDVRLNINTGITYDFPRWSAIGRFGEGWEIGGLYTGLTGRPFTAFMSSAQDSSGQDKNSQRPDCLAKPTYQYSNPHADLITNAAAVFGAPAPGTIGTCGRNAFRGPRFDQIDFNVLKTTKITERFKLQLRFEIFNLFNHPNVNPTPAGTTIKYTSATNPCPGTKTGCPTGGFGKFSQTPDIAAGNPFLSQGGPRAAQIGLKLIF